MKLWHIFYATLREIFDETAFERYCKRERRVRSRQAYALFLRESDPEGRPKARCC